MLFSYFEIEILNSRIINENYFKFDDNLFFYNKSWEYSEINFKII